jgi:peptide chain release factor 3
MDRNHRDRIAFARICSGRFDRGMVMTCERTGKPFATKYASTVFGAERTTVDEAFPGDVVGLVNATGLNLGDTLYDDTGPSVKFPPIPAFAPEVFATARPLDTGKTKQFRKGLDQLNEEGVVQVLKDPDWGDASPVLAAVGQLQFDVFANRLDIEFNAPIEIISAPYQAIRLTDRESADSLREKPGVRILARLDGRLVALFENKYALARIEQNEPELTLDHIIAG